LRGIVEKRRTYRDLFRLQTKNCQVPIATSKDVVKSIVNW